MDECTRQKMMMLSPGKTRVQIDIPQIVLGLLNFTFKSDFSNEKSYMQWKNRQVLVIFGLFEIDSFPCQNSGKLGVSMPSCSFLALLFIIINFRAGLVLLVCISSWIVYVVSYRKLLSWSIA